MTKEDFQREAEAMRPMLLQAAAGLLGSAADAEDAVQDALLKLWGMADTLRSPVAPLAKVLVRNLCVDRLRRHRQTVPLELTAVQAVPQEGTDGDAFAHVMKVIDTLPAAQQVVLRLRHIDGMPMDEIARLTGASEAAVRKQLSRARMAVRKHYLDTFEDE